MSDLPKRIRILCAHAGLRPIDLAKKLKVDKAAVCRWMKDGKGGSRPRMPMEKVARALGRSLVEFYTADLDVLGAEVRRREAAAEARAS